MNAKCGGAEVSGDRWRQIALLTNDGLRRELRGIARIGTGSGSHWDLIIADEAHRMSATYFGNEVKYTKCYRLGRDLDRVKDADPGTWAYRLRARGYIALLSD